MSYYDFVHNLGLHFWDIPTFIVFAVMIVVGIVHTHNHKKREAAAEDAQKNNGMNTASGNSQTGI